MPFNITNKGKNLAPRTKEDNYKQSSHSFQCHPLLFSSGRLHSLYVRNCKYLVSKYTRSAATSEKSTRIKRCWRGRRLNRSVILFIFIFFGQGPLKPLRHLHKVHKVFHSPADHSALFCPSYYLTFTRSTRYFIVLLITAPCSVPALH